jgi:hypothetical protein
MLKTGYTAVTIRESASARRLAERQQTRYLLAYEGARTNEHRLFDSAEHLTGRAPADDTADQDPKNNNAMRLLYRRRRRGAPHADKFWCMET